MSFLPSRSPAASPDLSIIIVNCNTRDLLAQCLESVWKEIRTSPQLEVETLVVDNASIDGSGDMMRKQFSWVRLIENQENAGFARANNQGLRIGRGRYFLLLNSDTIVLPGCVMELVHFADTHPAAGILGCRLLNTDGSLQESWASFPTLWSEIMGRNFRRRRLLEESPVAYEVDWVGGACMLARSAAINEVGMLDEDYFMYSEETDWCYRMKQAGWSVYYLPSAEVIHLGGGSAGRTSLIQLTRLYVSKIRFFGKHYSAHQARLLRYGLIVVNALGMARRLVVWPLQWKNRAEIKGRLDTQWGLIGHLLRMS